MRVVFMGTPDAAVPTLRALAEDFDVVAVYTRPDKPKGRGRRVESSPVKAAATELGVAIEQPQRLRGAAEQLASYEPDLVVVVAYGAILPADVLAVPRLSCVNVHFSLLPRWRGAAPVERAIMAGDERTGATTMLMDEGLDTGPILLHEPTPISATDTSGSVRERLADMGASLLVRTVRELEAGSIEAKPQPADGVTIAAKIDAADRELDPGATAAELDRIVRALDPAPGAFLRWRDKRLNVWKTEVVPGTGEVGTLTGTPAIEVQTSDGRLRLVEVQPEGKKRMPGAAFANGYRPVPGERVGP